MIGWKGCLFELSKGSITMIASPFCCCWQGRKDGMVCLLCSASPASPFSPFAFYCGYSGAGKEGRKDGRRMFEYGESVVLSRDNIALIIIIIIVIL